MQFDDMRARALNVRSRFAILERSRDGRAWSVEDLALGLVGDVGDLVKLVQMQRGHRPAPTDLDGKLSHEFADCLWALICLADAVDVDLESAFVDTMRQLDAYLESEGAVE